MKCEKCKNKTTIAGQAFTKYVCDICKDSKSYHNTAIPKICKECSEKNNICEKCGIKVDKLKTLKDFKEYKNTLGGVKVEVKTGLIDKEELRQEGIKWIKELEKDFCEGKKKGDLQCRHYDCTGRQYQITIIKKLFNITGEELK